MFVFLDDDTVISKLGELFEMHKSLYIKHIYSQCITSNFVDVYFDTTDTERISTGKNNDLYCDSILHCFERNNINVISVFLRDY